MRCGRRSGETRIKHAYRICETFADFSLERVKASVTKHDECDFLILVCIGISGIINWRGTVSDGELKAWSLDEGNIQSRAPYR